MRRALLILLTAFPLIGAWVVVPGLSSGGIPGTASASPSAQVPGQIDRVLIDADTTQDGVQTCRSASVGDSVAVDIILDEVDPADGTLDGGSIATAALRYTDAPLDLISVAIHPDSPWAIGQMQTGNEQDLGDGTRQLAGYTAMVFPGNGVPFSGVQPLFRVTFGAVANGLATINLGNVPGLDDTRDITIGITYPDESQKLFDPFDDNEDGGIIQSLQGAFIAVGEACPQSAPEPFSDEPTTRTPPEADMPDEDGDGVPDANDAFPSDPTEDADSDGDGIGDNADTDDDNDDVEDAVDLCPGTAPRTEVDEDGCSSTQLPRGGAQPGPGDGGTNWAIVLAIVAPIAALAAAGAAWWRLRRRGAFDRGGD